MTLDLQILQPGTTAAQESGNVTTSPELTSEYTPFFSQLDRLYHHDATQSVTPVSNEIDDTIEIGSLLDPSLRLRESIVVEVRPEGAIYVAKCAVADESGTGADPISAMQSFRGTIAVRYWELKEGQERLSRDSDVAWQRLSALIYEV